MKLKEILFFLSFLVYAGFLEQAKQEDIQKSTP